MKVGMNIKILRKRTGKSQEEVASALGLTRSSYSGYENGVADPGIETLVHVSDYFKVPLDVILRKDFSEYTEEMFGMLEKDRLADVEGKKLRILTQIVNEEGDDLIEMIPAKARAGYTSGYADPEYLKVLPTFTLPFLSKDRKYRSFPIKGDSMPPVVDGSYVVGDFIQNWMHIKNGTPCIVITKEDGIVFKVVYNQLAENESFLLVSTNPLYEPYTVHVSEVLEIWKFVNYISPELPEVKIDENAIGKSITQLQKEVHELKILIQQSK